MAETAEDASETARAIIALRERHRSLVREHDLGRFAPRLLDILYHQPIVNVGLVEKELAVSFVTANKLLMRFADLGLVEETTGHRRNRRFRYAAYLSLFAERVDPFHVESSALRIGSSDESLPLTRDG